MCGRLKLLYGKALPAVFGSGRILLQYFDLRRAKIYDKMRMTDRAEQKRPAAAEAGKEGRQGGKNVSFF